MAKRTILKTWLVISIFLVVLGGPATVAGKTIYVDDDAAGANDGSSWQSAYTFLQDALADAYSTEKPVEIRVAQGIYKPNQGVNISQVIFFLINEVTLVGGYAGVNEHDPNERNIQLYETILSGDLASNDIDVNNLSDLLNEPTHSDNGPIIYSGYSINQTAVLDGFVITGGRNTAVPFELIVGGGGIIIDRGSSPTISNCTFIGNAALACGGGMLTKKNSSPIVTNCKFIRNYAGSGGGVYNVNSSPVFSHCLFEGNYAEHNAGGMGNLNEWWRGLELSCNPVIINCIFSGNYAQRNGGGVASSDANSMLIDCIFIDNSSSGSGGGLSGVSSIYNCIMSSNTAVGNGGAIYGWGEVVNCTIIGNRASGKGGGICAQGITTLTNSIVHSNNALIGDEICAGLRIIGGRGTVLRIPSSVTVSHSNVRGGEEKVFIDTDCTLVWKPGNIDVDPLFAAPGYWADATDSNIAADPNNPNAFWVDGDYHLKSQAGRWDPNGESWVQDDVTSPCIDAGDPNSPIGHEPFPNGGIINMGAYGGIPEASKSYFGEPVCETIIAGDINGDCKVDFKDFAIMALHWLEER